MTSTDELLELLEGLALSRNEARVYMALLGISPATAAELGDASRVPRAKIYSVLRNLEFKSFAISLDGPVSRFQAVDPMTALSGWIRQREHDREFANEADRRTVTELLRALPELRSRRNGAATPAYIAGVSGKTRISEVSEQTMGLATQTLLMVQQPPYFQPPSHWNAAELDAVSRGVDVRVIYSREAVADGRRYRSLLEVGVQLRVLDDAPMKLICADESQALVALRDPMTGEQAVMSAIIHHPDLVAAMVLLFEKEWDRAEPFCP
jgi:sugar-specific transcriptional regulator TrmB